MRVCREVIEEGGFGNGQVIGYFSHRGFLQTKMSKSFNGCFQNLFLFCYALHYFNTGGRARYVSHLRQNHQQSEAG